MIKKEYKNGEITVVWQPNLCIHSGVCFHSLPKVFRPRERPWIKMENADSATITDTVNACPSGALSLKKTISESLTTTVPSRELPHFRIVPDGPLQFKGPCLVTLEDGTVVEKPNGVSICRCGESASYPFCDSSHKTNGFKG